MDQKGKPINEKVKKFKEHLLSTLEQFQGLNLQQIEETQKDQIIKVFGKEIEFFPDYVDVNVRLQAVKALRKELEEGIKEKSGKENEKKRIEFRKKLEILNVIEPKYFPSLDLENRKEFGKRL